MAWDVVMFGALSVPERNVEDWLTAPILTDALPWLEELGGDDVHLDTAEGLLAFLGETTVAPHELFEVTHDAGQLSVRCFVAEDAFRETSQALALAFASAAPFGASGALTFFGYQGIRFAERLTVSGARATFARLERSDIAALERSEAFRSLDQQIHARFDALVGRAPAPLDARGARWVINPFTGRKVREPATP